MQKFPRLFSLRTVYVALPYALIGTWSVACGPASGDPPADVDHERPAVVDDGLPPASDFSCPLTLAAGVTCLDFNDGEMPGLMVEEGSYQVVGERLVGRGPAVPAQTCGGSNLSHALISGTTARDVRVHMQMASIGRVDKAIALRSPDAQNRVQLNFRAHDETGAYGDLMVQQMVDCTFTTLTAEGEIPLDHEVGQLVDVVAELVGAHLKVTVDEVIVIDRDFALSTDSGLVGMAVIDRAQTVFDDVIIENLDAQ